MAGKEKKRKGRKGCGLLGTKVKWFNVKRMRRKDKGREVRRIKHVGRGIRWDRVNAF